jgi:hypothetical protein
MPYAYTQTLKMYPLSQAANPPPTRFVDGRTYNVHTLPFYDIRALEDIHDIIDVEPVQPQDKVMMGMLASIGIERGKPFAPQGAMKAALEHGAADAYFYMHDLDTKLFASHLYWPDRHWSFVMVPDAAHGFDFVTDDAVQVDQRAARGTSSPSIQRHSASGSARCISHRPRIAQGARWKLARPTA